MGYRSAAVHPGSLLVYVNLVQVDVLPWDSKVAAVYGDLRTSCEAVGLSLADMDHAISVAAILATRDKAFSYMKNKLVLENWI